MKENKNFVKNKLIGSLLVAAVVSVSLVLPAKASSIINADGSEVPGQVLGSGNKIYQITPTGFYDGTGFRSFQELNLTKDDIMNFIFTFYQQQQWTDDNGVHHQYRTQDVKNFVNLVSDQISINGIVNAIKDIGGPIANGNLMFISPKGMVVGASGVLNVGSLSVITPTQTDFDALAGQIPTAGIRDSEMSVDAGKVISISGDPLSNYTIDPNQSVNIQGRIAARGDINIDSGSVIIGDKENEYNARVFAGLGNTSSIEGGNIGSGYEMLKTSAQADVLFDKLVNTDNMNTANGFAKENGDIVIKSINGTTIDQDSMVRNYAASSNTTITNTQTGGINVLGEVSNAKGTLKLDNNGGQLKVASTGLVKNSGNMIITNKNNGTEILVESGGEVINSDGELNIHNYSGADGININGAVTNTGITYITNDSVGTKGLNVGQTGVVTNNGSSVNMTNNASGGTNISGKVQTTNKGAVNITNENSNTTIGDNSSNDFYIDADGNVTITNTNGNVLNGNTTLRNNTGKTLIRTTKDSGASLTITATNGAIGEEVGSCDGGICTGVGPSERDLTKSINTNIDGTITATSTKGTNKSLINMASLDNDMNVDKIHADGRVILLADSAKLADKGKTPYNVLNRTKDRTGKVPNIKGSGISIIASGDIGEQGKALTFIQTGAKVDVANEHDDETQPHDLIMDSEGHLAPVHTGDGVEMLAIGDINAKGLDNADGTKNDTNICTIASRTGTVNLELSGNSYIRDITAQKEVNVVNRGTELYIENLGGAPSRYAKTGDYYGGYEGIVPEKANLKVLDLGTVYAPNEEPNSTLVVMNGTINGKGSTSHPGMDQDVTVTADNAYIGGYYFNMGKHRMPGLSSVTKDDRTNTLTPIGDKPVSIRGRAVRPEDVTAIGRDPKERIYYYGKEDGDPDDASGSGQRDDPTFDKDKEDGDDLVVPEPTKDTTPTKPTEDTTPTQPTEDTEDTTPTQPTEDTEDTTPTQPTEDTEDTTPTQPTEDTEDTTPTQPTEDTEDTTPTQPTEDTEDTTPTQPTEDTEDTTPTQPTEDTEDTTPTQPTEDTEDTTPTQPTEDTEDTTPTQPTEDTEDTTPTQPTIEPTEPAQPDVMDEARLNIRQRVVEENFDAIDKRQYMRFDIDNTENNVVFQSSPEVESVVNISRGGVSLAHNKKLKVGDVVPVHLKYGDIEIDADVKVVSATDKRAGAEFINLDEATQTKLLYLSLIEEGKTIKMDPNVTAQNGYGIKNVTFQPEEANSLGD